MATFVLTDAKIWIAQYDFSGDHNSIGLDYGAEMKDDSVFGDSTRSNKGGLKTVELSGGGFVDLADDAIDEIMFGNVAVADKPVSLSAEGGDEGEVGYMFKSILAEYNIGGDLGEMFGFTIRANGAGDLVRGTVMQNGVETTSGQATARQLGAVSATQKLYAAMHVLAVSGGSPTLDVLVRSDDAENMASPATRITFTQATTITSEWATPVAGAITDDWWDIDMTIGGSTPSFTVVVIVGIQ